MKALNEQATKLFIELVKQLSNKDYLNLRREGYMALSFECIGQSCCSYGTAKMYSLLHTFTQNGDLMRDPEICFFHFEENDQNSLSGVYPYSYQLDPLGIFQESIHLINGELIINLMLQKQHADFANAWLHNIKEQGFIQ